MHFNCFTNVTWGEPLKNDGDEDDRRRSSFDASSSGGSSKLVAAAALAHLKEMRIRTHNFVRHDGFSPKVPRDR